MRLRSEQYRGRRGAVLAWLVISLGVIILVLALSMDGGRMLEERRRVQSAADAAALAGAAELFNRYSQEQGQDPSGLAQTAAREAAARNGFSDDDAQAAVTVNIPPQQGSFAGRAEYVEVIIESRLRGGLSSALRRGELPVRARAVAMGRPRRMGLLVLKPSGADTLKVSGNASIQVVNGSVVVNSTDDEALEQTGNATIAASSHEITGGYRASTTSLIGKVYTGVAPTDDPLRTFPAPELASLSIRSTSKLNISGSLTSLQLSLSLGGVTIGSDGSITLNPGIFQGGISISGNTKVTLTPGIYYLAGGGFSVSGNGELIAERVMFYNSSGGDCDQAEPFKISGNGKITITPPSEGPYQGISFFQDRSVTSIVQISGNGSTHIGGTIYAPAATVKLSGNGTTDANSLGGSFICNTLQVSGNGSFSVDLGSNRPRAPEVRLVE